MEHLESIYRLLEDLLGRVRDDTNLLWSMRT